jgi:hypothetical protein
MQPGVGYRAVPRGEAAHRLRALVLLGGSVRQTELSRGIDRSTLDLPVSSSTTILGQWVQGAGSIATSAGATRFGIRLVINRDAVEPSVHAAGAVALSVERDRAELRGTGGLLRDLASDYAPDELMLVANAAQVLLAPLPELVGELFDAPGDVRMIAHRDGTPAGLFLVRCGVLSSLGAVGFMDFKEQVLPKLSAAGHEIRVVHRATATGMPVRTVESYIESLRRWHRQAAGLPASRDPFEEHWESSFTLIEDGASVDPRATLQDSVVLRGAAVRRGGVVVRSLVSSGAVTEGQTIVDGIVTRAADSRTTRAGDNAVGGTR